jgi:hypothetical protein
MSTVPQAIIAEAQRQGVDPALALEVAQEESGMNPNVPDSYTRAIGIFQLEPPTAQQLGVNPRDPMQNIQGGITYLRMMVAQFGDPMAALAAYNGGPGNVQKAINANGSGWFSTIPASVQSYVSRILNNVQTQYGTVTGFTAAAAGGPYPGGGTSILTIPSDLLSEVSVAAPASFSWGTVALVMGAILGVGLVLDEI